MRDEADRPSLIWSYGPNLLAYSRAHIPAPQTRIHTAHFIVYGKQAKLVINPLMENHMLIAPIRRHPGYEGRFFANVVPGWRKGARRA